MQGKVKEFIDNINNYYYFERQVEKETERLVNSGLSDFVVMRLYHNGCPLIDILRHRFTHKTFIRGLGSFSRDIYSEDRVFKVELEDVSCILKRSYAENKIKFDTPDDRKLGVKARAIYNILNTVGYLSFDKNTTVDLIVCILRGLMNESEYTEKRIFKKVSSYGG